VKHWGTGILATLCLLVCGAAANAGAKPAERVKAFAKLPDWSGLWEQYGSGATGAPDTPDEFKASMAPVHPPYNKEWEAKAVAAARERASQPDRRCGTIGFPGLMIGSSLMFEVVITPELTLLHFNFSETRHIYTDGKPLPPEDEWFGTSWGASVGHWEDQTLVVDTVASSSPVTAFGDPISENATYHERIRMADKNTLEDQLTVTDPIALTAPWQLTRRYQRVPNMTRLVEEECGGNERDVRVNGTFTIAPPRAQ
jgi:hypothetical protein